MMKMKVGKEKILACLTCPICYNLFADATTISECLHTFCRRCIYEKIANEKLDHCPVCNIHLGCVPLDKLRVDNNLQDLRAKIFPFEIKTGNTSDAVLSALLPSKRKERSLSSLVVTAPRGSPRSSFPGRKKYPTRRNLARQETALPDNKPVKKPEACPENLSLSEKMRKTAVNGKQASINDNVEDNVKPYEGKDDMCKTLNSLVEKRANKANLQETIVDSAHKSEVHEPKVLRVRKQGVKRSRGSGSGKDTTPEPSGPVKRRKTRRQRGVIMSEGCNVPAQSLNVANREFGRRFSSVWFSLIASNEQQGNAPLPQISSCYLRVKDGSLPVSLIKKYLVKKLALASEAEVEISIRGQPVIPTLELHNLVDLWIQRAPSPEMIHTSMGSSGKDFVMVLSYARKCSARA